jgi:hypothetical protein
VYGNIAAKWATVLRKPERLLALFTGYQASRSLIAAVLARLGVDAGGLCVEGASLASWGEREAHRLVAHFLHARFPILLALNKSDLPAARQHLERVRAAHPRRPAVAVSAAAERWLCQQRRAGAIAYSDGSARPTPAPGCPEDVRERLEALTGRVQAHFGSTGVLAALTAAVAMRPPALAFPVAELEACASLPFVHGGGGGGGIGAGADAKARAAEGPHGGGALRDCLLMKPGSTVVDVFTALKRQELLAGDFIRAECRVVGGEGGAAAPKAAVANWRLARKEEEILPGNCVLRILTNRKSAWQHGAAAAAAAAAAASSEAI